MDVDPRVDLDVRFVAVENYLPYRLLIRRTSNVPRTHQDTDQHTVDAMCSVHVLPVDGALLR